MNEGQFVIQPLKDYVETHTENNRKNMIGELDDISRLSDVDFDFLLRSSHPGPFCLLVFHPDIHELFSDFVVSGALEIYSKSNTLFLVCTPKEIVGIQEFEILMPDYKFSSSSQVYEPFELVRSILMDKSSNVAFPGFLFFRSLLSSGEPVFVAAPDTQNIDTLGKFAQSVTLLAANSIEKGEDGWSDRLATALALRGYEYCRGSSVSALEGLAHLIRRIWKSRQDIGVLLGAG